jgi:intermediate cleaving peptidase 55
MRFAEPGASEAHLVAHFEYICSLAGSQRPAYLPVVASGANSLVIHYTENDCLLQSGELVLIDAGAELDSYASDITRTFPVSGTFSSAQRDLYEAVLQVNKRCIALCELDQNWSSNAMHTASQSKPCALRS